MTKEDAEGVSVDSPKVADLVNPALAPVMVMTAAGPVPVDMRLFAEASEKLGADKYDTFSFSCYRNAKGELVPIYESIRIERRSGSNED